MARDPTERVDREDRRNRALLALVEALEEGHEPDRERFLAEHPDLAPDIEAFLAGHDEVARLTAPLRAGRRGNAPGPAGADREKRDHEPAALGELGDFRLLREVGRGGMGVVYEAEQISLSRRVALKVLPFAAAIDPRRLQRFKTEALTAAHVQHERIVPVHAVGCERGVHYYAMQFIDGQSLASLIQELRAPAEIERDGEFSTDSEPGLRQSLIDGRGTSRPTVSGTAATLSGRAGRDPHPTTSQSNIDGTFDCRELRSEDGSISTALAISRERSADRRRYFDRVAGLARQAALALEHAHQGGIVHRDVKPGNLLLDLRGQLWITDFGLAQVTGDTGLTITGEMLGTLRYSSPEQVLAHRGFVDHRSDVYSLGATLYELLTLRPPFDGRDRNTLIRQIGDEDPPAPRSVEPSIPVELETIALQALRKEPADRYLTAQEMADDLERFLDGRPILARPPTASERLRTWSRQHPALVGSGVVALLLLTAASLVSAALIRREERKTLAEQRNAEAAYQREHQRALEAEERFRLARRAVDELIRASEEELTLRPGMEGLRKRLLTAALAYYREFIAERRNDPDAQAELLDTTHRVETILADLELLRAAGELYLLAQPSALDDLRLDPEQRRKVADLSARAGKRWVDAFGDPAHMPAPAERVRIVLEQVRTNEGEIDAILTPSQRGRLRQIALQAEGPAAFREPEVVEALVLTPGQRERIRGIEEGTLFRQIREIRAGRSSDTSTTGSSPIHKILAVLTPEQAQRWREITGTPIRGRLSVFPMPFRPGRDGK
jgi:serine/threonine protein kinase